MIFFFFQAEDGIRDSDMWLEFRRVLFRSQLSVAKGQVKPEHLFVYTFSSVSMVKNNLVKKNAKFCCTNFLLLDVLPYIEEQSENREAKKWYYSSFFQLWSCMPIFNDRTTPSPRILAPRVLAHFALCNGLMSIWNEMMLSNVERRHNWRHWSQQG